MPDVNAVTPESPTDFIREIVTADVAAGKHGGRSSPASRPSPTATSTSATPSRSASTSAWRRSSAATATCASTTPIPTKEDVEYVDAIKDDVRWLGFDWDDREFYASDYFEQLYEFAGAPDPAGQGLRRLLVGRRDPRVPRHADRARARDTRTATAASTRTSICSARMRAGEFADGAHVLRAKIDMASPNINMRDPVLYRIRHADASPHRRRVVHLPDVRLRAPAVGRDRGHHALALHARVRDHRPLYDWVRRECQACAPAAADRVRAAEPELHGDEQAQAAAAGASRSTSAAGTTRACRRSPACAGAATRRRRSAPSARASAWRRRRTSSTSALLEHCVREDLNKPRAARDGRAAAAQARDRELPGGPGRGRRRRQQPGGRGGGHAQGAVLARALHRARRLPEDPPKKFFRLAPGREVRLRYAYFITCTDVVKDAARRGHRAALHLRPGHARRRRARRPQGEGHAALGVGGARASTPRCGSTTGCSSVEDPGRAAEGGRRSSTLLNPASLEVVRGCKVEPSWAAPRRARASSSSASATSAPTPTPRPARRCSTARSRSRTPRK